MNKSPFKVMTTAALATALAVPAVATTAPATVDAAETEVLSVAISLDGEVQVVSYDEFVNAIFDGEGDVYELYSEGTIASVSVEEGKFVDYEALSNALFDAEEGTTTTEVLAELNTQEDALVDEDTVAEYEEYGEEVVEELAVESVTASNLKNVTVNFNTAVDSETLDVAGTDATVKVYKNGAETMTTLDGSNLSEDGKTLELALPSLNQSDEVTVKIDGLEALDMNYTLADFEETVTATDVSAPEAESVEVLNNKTINVHFSEPVDLDTDGVFETTSVSKTGALMKVDGDLVYAKFTPYPAQNYVEVEFFNSLDDGNHTLELSEVNDFAGFEAPAETFNFNTETDEEAPVATDVNYVGKNTVEVTFSEKVQNIGTAQFGVYQAGDSTNLFSSAMVKADGKTVKLTLSPSLNVAATVGFDVQYKNVEDVFGNELSEYKTISGEATDDTTAPDVKNVEVLEGNDLKVTFTEPVNAAKDNFNLYKADGETLVSSSATTITDVNGDKVTWEVEFSSLANVNGGNYQLEVENVVDTSIRGNKVATEQYAVTVTDSVQPTLLNAVIDENVDSEADNDQVELVFDEGMELDKLEDIKNYFVGTSGSADTSLSTISGAKVLSVAGNGQRVTLKVPGYAKGDLIAAPTLTDDSGNLLSNASISSPITLSDQFPDFNQLNVDEAVADSKNQITVSLTDASTSVFADVDVDDFKFDASGNVDLGLTSAQVSPDGKSVKLTFSKDLNANGKFSGDLVDGTTVSNQTVSVYTSSSSNNDTVDQNDTKFLITSGNAVTVNDGINPSYDSYTRANSVNNVSNIDLKFTEKVYAEGKDDIVASNFEVYDAEGNRLTNLLTTGTLSAGEYKVSDFDSDDTVTLEVYGEDADTYEIKFTGSDYLDDNGSGAGNKAENFSVEIDAK